MCLLKRPSKQMKTLRVKSWKFATFLRSGDVLANKKVTDDRDVYMTNDELVTEFCNKHEELQLLVEY